MQHPSPRLFRQPGNWLSELADRFALYIQKHDRDVFRSHVFRMNLTTRLSTLSESKAQNR